MLFRRRSELACRQAIELMTDYLDGALLSRDRSRLEDIWPSARTAASTSPRSKRPSPPPAKSNPTTLPPEALDELVSLYRQWRTG